MQRIIEAELWGTAEDPVMIDGLTVRPVRGTYGTWFQVEVRSMWTWWRLPAILGRMIDGATWLPDLADDDDECSNPGVMVIHFWKEKTRDHVTAGAPRPATQIGKPAHHVPVVPFGVLPRQGASAPSESSPVANPRDGST